VSGQVVTFMCDDRGAKVPSPALYNKIGTAFRRSVMSFATECTSRSTLTTLMRTSPDLLTEMSPAWVRPAAVTVVSNAHSVATSQGGSPPRRLSPQHFERWLAGTWRRVLLE
jgi:hypothetical protein